ncbi:hypothetical protein FRB91_001888 [Serendipita sp. 411]|nr:hypothetical protein FRB91_001888 [Serendipita sp. 411]
MDSFSWSDSIRATIGSCIPCLKADDSDDELREGQGRGQRRIGATSLRNNGLSAREELERLLDEPITDAEDAETMSLHSNVGNRKTKKRKSQRGQKTAKSVRVLGIDLFGRRSAHPPPSAVENENDEETSLARDNPRRTRTISTSTLDSDAAPLADDVIVDFTSRAQERWAPSRTDEELAIEERMERERIEKELRKEQRKERKEMKRLAETGAFSSSIDGEEFEGFPGSGQVSRSGIPSSDKGDEFGPFVTSTSSQPTPKEDKELEDEADFDAAAYTKNRRTGNGEGSRSGSGSHSRSRSRTSASLSVDGSTKTHEKTYRPKARSSEKGTVDPRSPLSDKGSPNPSTPRKQSKRSKQSKSSRASSSATTSIPSPISTPSPDVRIDSQDFDGELHCYRPLPSLTPSLGVPGGLISARDHFNAFTQSSNLPSPSFPSPGFPSTGFTSFKRATSTGLNSGAGVALARRGDD